MTAPTGTVASLAENLERVLDEIVATADDLFSNSTIDFVEHRSRRESERYGVVFVGLPDGTWGPLNDAQRQLQRRVLELWDPWIEQMRLLFSGDTKEAQQEINDAAKGVAGGFTATATSS